ncbi:MAG: hypothetical protein QX199_06510 [Methylococcaceae bacterium]
MTKIIKIIALLSFALFSVAGHAKQKTMSDSMDMKQCMKMEQCKGMKDHSKMAGGMDMKQCMKMPQCKGMMDHSNMTANTAPKRQKTKTNNVFE